MGINRGSLLSCSIYRLRETIALLLLHRLQQPILTLCHLRSFLPSLAPFVYLGWLRWLLSHVDVFSKPKGGTTLKGVSPVLHVPRLSTLNKQSGWAHTQLRSNRTGLWKDVSVETILRCNLIT